MPIYEYQCEKCQEILEISQKMSEAALTECPQCTGPLRKLISRTSFQLKGGGWYQSDYKKPSAAKSSAEPSSKEKPEKSDKTETPAATTPAKPKGGCGSGGCGHNH